MSQERWPSVDADYWRIVFKDKLGDLLAPARAPQGRWHHDGQKALYLSSSASGAGVALRRYVKTGDPSRVLSAVHVTSDRIADTRDPETLMRLGFGEATRTDCQWHLVHASGQTPVTWSLADRAREAGLNGLHYASRTSPQETHLVLLRWNETGGAQVRLVGDALPWRPDTGQY